VLEYQLVDQPTAVEKKIVVYSPPCAPFYRLAEMIDGKMNV